MDLDLDSSSEASVSEGGEGEGKEDDSNYEIEAEAVGQNGLMRPLLAKRARDLNQHDVQASDPDSTANALPDLPKTHSKTLLDKGGLNVSLDSPR